MKHRIQTLFTSPILIIHMCVLFILMSFSVYLMVHTFGYDKESQTFLIAPKCWSDFGAHIPLIRSFSKGPNSDRLFTGKQVESPLYPGEPIRYHFGFYALAGLLERAGMSIDWALNIPSIIGFLLLTYGIYWFSYSVFKHVYVGILSLLFFLFNGSFAFVRYFQTHPISITSMLQSNKFTVFGPWDGQNISAFWTLNIYTNQRHLALSYGIILVILLMIWKFVSPNNSVHTPQATKNRLRLRTFLIRLLIGDWTIDRNAQQTAILSISLSICMMLLMYFNHAALGIIGIFLIWLFFAYPRIRIALLLSGIISLPAFLYLSHISYLPTHILYNAGYLAPKPLTLEGMLTYWIDNIGLHMLFIPLGIVFSPKKLKKFLGIPLLILCIAPNIWQFSPDMINNHKFFNFAIILGSMLSAYALFRMFWITNTLSNLMTVPLKNIRKIPICFIHISTNILRIFYHSILIGCFILLVLSGVIDLFPIINDPMGGLPDVKQSSAAEYIEEHTNPDDVVLNSFWFYHPSTIAGRSIFSGYPYFTWSYGYDKDKREKLTRDIYAAHNQHSICSLLHSHNISLVELSDNPEYVTPNMQVWNTLPISFRDEKEKISLYQTDDICLIQQTKR